MHTTPLPSSTGWSFRGMVSRRSKAGIVLGIALAAWGFFGGSYQHRGVGRVASGSDLVRVGAAIAVISTVLVIVCRKKPPI